MKKILVVISMFAILSGCDAFSKLNTIEYNNEVVEQINETSTQLEKTATLYNETVPTVVTENIEIKTEDMLKELSSAQDLVKEIDSLANVESKDEEQQASVTTAITDYKTKADAYLTAYQEMYTYYSSGEYKTDISKVTDLDENIHTTYSAFIEQNNTLVGILDSYVDENK